MLCPDIQADHIKQSTKRTEQITDECNESEMGKTQVFPFPAAQYV